MDWLHDFQQSFREPVYGFLTTFWPVIGVIVLMGLGWLVGGLVRRGRTGDGGDGGATVFGDADGDSGGGDGGGGD